MTSLFSLRNGSQKHNTLSTLLIVEVLIFILLLLCISYIIYHSNYYLELSHLMMFVFILLLILGGLMILRKIFKTFSKIAAPVKNTDQGETCAIGFKENVTESHNTSLSLNTLVQKLEESSAQLRQRTFELSILKDLFEDARKMVSIDDLMDLILVKGMAVTGARIGSIFMVEADTRHTSLVTKRFPSDTSFPVDSILRRFRVAASKGHSPPLEKNSYINIENSLAKTVILEGKTLLVQDIEKDPRTSKINDPHYGSPSFLSMPVFAGNRLVAVVNLACKESGQPFNSNDEHILSIMLGEISFALENSLLHSELEKDLQKTPHHTIELEREIEGHRRVDTALRESEKKYRELFDFIPVPLFEITLDGDVLSANPSTLQTFGYDQEDLDKGINVFSLFIPGDLGKVKEDIQRVLNRETIGGFKYSMIKKDGSLFPVVIFASPIVVMSIPVGLRGAIIDLTEHKRAEEQLRATTHMLQTTIDSSPLAIIVIDNNNRVNIWNPAAERMFGWKKEEVTGTILPIIPDERREEFDKICDVRNNREIVQLERSQRRRRDGSLIDVSVAVAPIVDAAGNIAGGMGILTDITELLQRERKIRELDFIVNKSPAIAFLWRNAEGWPVEYVSDNISQFGYQPDDFTSGRIPYASIIHPDDLDRVAAEVAQYCQEGREEFSQEYRIFTASGESRWVDDRTWIRRDAEGTITHYQGIILDITTRKQAEEALRESEENYRRIVENSLQGLIIVQDFRIVFANERCAEITGYAREELLSLPPQKVRDIIHLDDQVLVWGRFADRVEGKAIPNRYEYRSIKKDGSVRWVEMYASRTEHKGKPAVQAALIDVTDRKRAEEELKQSEMRYRSLAASIDSMYLVDRDCTYLFINEGHRKRLGLSEAEIIGRRYSDFHTGDDTRKFMECVRAVCETGKPIIREHRSERDGNYFLRTFSPLMDSLSAEGISKVVIVSKDITNLKQMEKELQEAKDQLFHSEKLAALGQLSTGVAHEILNPVNIISMELQLLQTMGNLPSEAHEELRVCMDQIKRIVSITDNLKQCARIPEKKMTLASINDVISRVLNLYATQLKIEEIETVKQYQPDLPPSAMDIEKIEQVILNLVTNAVAAMAGKEEKILRITTEGDRDRIKVAVADTGTGIKGEDMSKIFDPFFTTREPGKGTGLGLYITYGIIHDHGGRIWAENNAWGGATLFIELPVKTHEGGHFH